MKKLANLPLVFFFVASLIGLLLRWHQYQPIDGLIYPYWLHAHSHTLFLGWVFNTLTVAFVSHFTAQAERPKYTALLIAINVLLVGMLVAFPLQGYGLYSITLSTLHTVLVVLFIVRFFRDTAAWRRCGPVLLARMSLVFFLISALGPFVLGALVANGLSYTVWYNLAVYYYLHFQYNGVFAFGVFSLFYQLLYENGISVDERAAKRFRVLLAVACFPAYSLSTLWTNPGSLIYGVAWMSVLLQMAALVYFIQSVRNCLKQFASLLSANVRILIGIAFIAFVFKLSLQLLSALPAVVRLAYEVRPFFIAYLHLVLIGMVSFFLLAWYQQQRIIFIKRLTLALLITGFTGSELTILFQAVGVFNYLPAVQVAATSLLVAGIGILLAGSNSRHCWQTMGNTRLA